MAGDDLKREIELLAERIGRIEQRLGLDVPASTPAAPTTAPPTQPSSAPAPASAQSLVEVLNADIAPKATAPSTGSILPKSTTASPPPLTPISPARVAALQRLRDERDVVPPPVVAANGPSTPPIAEPYVRPVSPTIPPLSLPVATQRRVIPDRRTTSLEELIGGKWMAWVGALVVVLAAGFAVKVGIDRGWWGNMGPATRCLLIAAFGGLMLGAGEIALRRIGRAASVGLFGAGLGTLYLDAYATFGHFQLITREWAFVYMAVVALIGFAITVRTRFLAIGVLAIVAGYLTPILLRGESSRDIELLIYLTTLLGVSLALSGFMPASFRPLRYVAMGCHAVVAGGWMIANAAQAWPLGIVFLSLWWAMVLGESLWASMREQSRLGNVVATLLATAGYVTLGCLLLRSGAPAAVQWQGAYALMVGLLGAAVAWQFGPGLDGLRSRPRSAIDALALALWIQFGVLLATAVALQFQGFGQTIGWLAIGLAGVEIGRRLPSRGVALFGLIVGALALARVMCVDWWMPGMRTPVWTFGDIVVSRWAILAICSVAALHIVAHRLRPDHWQSMPILLTVLATGLWMAVWAIHGNGLATTAAWLIAPAALLAAEQFGRRQRYLDIAIVALIATACRWLLIDALAARLSPSWNAAESLPVWNWQMGLAVAIAASAWWAFRKLRNRETIGGQVSLGLAWQGTLIVGSVFLLIALSLETDRTLERMAAAAAAPLTWSLGHVRQIMLTILWTAGATAVGFMARATGRRDSSGRRWLPVVLSRFAWALLCACALKWLVFDTLWWSLHLRPGLVQSAIPVANLQMLAGLVVAVAGIGLTRLLAPDRTDESNLFPGIAISDLAGIGSAVVILWGLSFEVDRALARLTEPWPAWLGVWGADHARALLWTALWATGGFVMAAVGRWRKVHVLRSAGWGLCLMCAAVWLTYDTIAWRFSADAVRATVIFNLQFAVGVVAAIVLGISAKLLPVDDADAPPAERRTMPLLGISAAAIVLIGLWLGSLEIDRAFDLQPMARQAGLSVYWGLWGIGLVLAGFLRRHAVTRYAGLGLLSITVAKVLLVDLANLDSMARVVSFLVSGLLLIATSVVYSRLAPKLLGKEDAAASPATEP